MEKIVVAVPSAQPGGMDAAIDAHFGHCALYTVVAVVDGAVDKVDTLPSVPHQQGGCMAPVNHLAENGVKALISGGIGMRPLMGFQQVGIKVYHGADAPSVAAALEAFIAGNLTEFTPERTCGGGSEAVTLP